MEGGREIRLVFCGRCFGLVRGYAVMGLSDVEGGR